MVFSCLTVSSFPIVGGHVPKSVESALAGQEKPATESTVGVGGAEPVPTSEVQTVPKLRKTPFQPGHPKWGGRQKGTKNKRTKLAQDMAAELGADPVKFMLTLLASDSMQVSEVDPDTGKVVLDAKGKPKKTWVPVSLEMKLDAAKSVAAYVHPKLQATQVTGANDGPIELATLDLTGVMADPKLSEAAQQLAMMMAEQDALAIEAGDDSEND